MAKCVDLCTYKFTCFLRLRTHSTGLITNKNKQKKLLLTKYFHFSVYYIKMILWDKLGGVYWGWGFANKRKRPIQGGNKL